LVGRGGREFPGHVSCFGRAGEVPGSVCVRLAILGMALVVAAAPAAACSPIVPLSILYSGPTVGAIVIGAGAGLALVVAVKCGLFAALCRDVHPVRAAGLMFLANAATTRARARSRGIPPEEGTTERQ
jgi:hypothetical protein